RALPVAVAGARAPAPPAAAAGRRQTTRHPPLSPWPDNAGPRPAQRQAHGKVGSGSGRQFGFILGAARTALIEGERRGVSPTCLQCPRRGYASTLADKLRLIDGFVVRNLVLLFLFLVFRQRLLGILDEVIEEHAR